MMIFLLLFYFLLLVYQYVHEFCVEVWFCMFVYLCLFVLCILCLYVGVLQDDEARLNMERNQGWSFWVMIMCLKMVKLFMAVGHEVSASKLKEVFWHLGKLITYLLYYVYQAHVSELQFQYCLIVW
jgi:hypothetical protein